MVRQAMISIAMTAVVLWGGSIGRAGTIVDYSGNGNDGTSYGDVTSATGPLEVPVFSFDGNGDFIATPDLGDPMTAGTFAAWVKFDTGYDSIAGWANGVFVGAHWVNGALRLEMFDGNNLRLAARTSTGARSDISTGFAPVAEAWYHMAVSFGVPSGTEGRSMTQLTITDMAGNVLSYTGAIYDESLTFTQSDVQFGGMSQAAGSDRDSFIDGDMTDLRFYAEALSASDIALLADTDGMTNPSSANLLVHYYPTVPEPGSLLLILTGLLGLAGFYKHKPSFCRVWRYLSIFAF